ncbi:flippase [Candidatus Uhrbacteria bacterium]|nr:flippase [Candidatus Uhrbacteria bacterium]
MTTTGVRTAWNTIFITGASIGQKVLSFVYFVFIARTYGVAQTGDYVFALSLSTIFSIVVDLGLSPVIVRETAKDPEQRSERLRAVLGAKLLLSIVAYALLLGTSFMIIDDARARMLVVFAGIVMVIDGWHLALYSTIRGFERLEFESIGVVVAQFSTILFGGVIMWLQWPVAWLFGALILGSAIHVIWASTILVRVFHIIPLPQWNSALVRLTFRMAIPFALAGIFAKAYTYTDTVLLGTLIDRAHVGLYSVAYKLAYSFQFLPMAFAASLYPAFSALATQSTERLASTFTRASHLLLLIVLPISFGIFSLADVIIPAFYGNAYRDAIPALQVLIFAMIFLFLTYPIGSLLNATHRQGIWTALMGFGMVVNIVINVLLIPKYTMVGAAYAALASQVFLVVSGFIVVARVMHVDWHAWLVMLVKAIVVVSVMTTVIIALKPYAHLAVLVAGGAIVYGIGVFSLRLLRLQDIITLVRRQNTI